MSQEIIQECKNGMEKRIKSFDNDLARVRTGRASITLLDNIKVDYYGSPTPLNQVATLSTPDARTLVVSPFEKSLIGEIEKSIMKADVGVQPNNDGNVIRLPIPPLTEDRRKDIVKSLKKMGEDAKIGIRQARKHANDQIKKLEKDKSISEDEGKSVQADIQKETDGFIKIVDEKLVKKEKEVMTI
ncbi:ribosome recycling factor [Oligoflexaceae bacterium]|nr:ribosome recycling factor [Oligoflexaceae bacterium]